MTLLAANELNLDAIDLIQTCLEREAIQLFDATWGTLNFLQPAQLLDDDPIAVGAEVVGRPSCFELESVSTDDFMSASIYQNNEWSVAAEPCYSFFTIFNRAFKFHPIEGDLEQMTRTCWFEFATNMPIAMLYNQGLAYHIWALREDSTALFSVALQHYNQAFRLIIDQSSMLQYKSEMDILYMGLLNNMGHCFGRLHNIEWMYWCHEQLHLMMSLPGRASELTKEEHEFFVDRIRFGAEFRCRPASAA